ncbi:hypothetical protein XENOCAPTIV_010120 [Xenoophorus captivus]|uniref:Uncharacterized protein n=1 Tax=Xenoophorus captivus TaxID=1517983 RepID=A0ABV0Q9X4_9TELE
MAGDSSRDGSEIDTKQLQANPTTEYCSKLQRWMWEYYWGYANWQSWVALSAFPLPPLSSAAQTPAAHGSSPASGQPAFEPGNWYGNPHAFRPPGSSPPSHPADVQAEQRSAMTAVQQNRSPPQAGRVLFTTPVAYFYRNPPQHVVRDIAKFITHFIIEEIDENTSIEDLQKMMVVALVYRVLTICIWGAGGATPGKFLLGLRVVTCDTSTMVRPNRIFVVPASNVSLSA